MKKISCILLTLSLLGVSCRSETPKPPVVTPPDDTIPKSLDLYEPNDVFANATVMTVGSTSNTAVIDGTKRDVDWYKFEGTKGDTVTIEVFTQTAFADSKLDSVVYLYPPMVNDFTDALGFNDDVSLDDDGNFGSGLEVTFGETATYYIKVTSSKIDNGFDDTTPKNTYKLKLTKKVAP